jgi:hypothetical protein
MTDYIVGCDNIVGGESGLIEKVCKVFESKGHTAERLNVGPNFVQSSGLKNSSSGKVAVFIVGGSDIGTYVDFRDGIKNGYYHWKYAWFAFASWTASTWITKEDLKNKPLVRAHDDNFSSGSSIAPYIGKSADYFFQENKQYVNYVYGQTPEELAKKILAGGGDSDDEGDSSASSIKDAIKEVMSFWDGEVECYVRDDTMYIHKIKDPEEECDILLSEGINIASDSVSITDYNPDTVNFLTVHWPGGDDIVYRDESLIARFGEKPLELDAVKKVIVTEEQEKTVDTSSTDTSTTVDTTDTDTSSTTDTTDTTTTTTETTTVTKTEEVPVETYEEAVNFANIEWAKIKRDDGHTLELKTVGSDTIREGQWCRVYLPSFNLDQYMYITRVSQSDGDSGWECSLSLNDYPPSLGEYQEESSEDEEDEDLEELDADADVDTGDV